MWIAGPGASARPMPKRPASSRLLTTPARIRGSRRASGYLPRTPPPAARTPRQSRKQPETPGSLVPRRLGTRIDAPEGRRRALLPWLPRRRSPLPCQIAPRPTIGCRGIPLPAPARTGTALPAARARRRESISPHPLRTWPHCISGNLVRRRPNADIRRAEETPLQRHRAARPGRRWSAAGRPAAPPRPIAARPRWNSRSTSSPG